VALQGFEPDGTMRSRLARSRQDSEPSEELAELKKLDCWLVGPVRGDSGSMIHPVIHVHAENPKPRETSQELLEIPRGPKRSQKSNLNSTLRMLSTGHH